MLPSPSSCHFTPQAPFEPRLRQMLEKTFSMSPNNQHIGSGPCDWLLRSERESRERDSLYCPFPTALESYVSWALSSVFFLETGIRLKSCVMAWRRIRLFVVLEIGITRLMTKKDSVILLTLMFLNMQSCLPATVRRSHRALEEGHAHSWSVQSCGWRTHDE